MAVSHFPQRLCPVTIKPLATCAAGCWLHCLLFNICTIVY